MKFKSSTMCHWCKWIASIFIQIWGLIQFGFMEQRILISRATGTYCLQNNNPPYCPKFLNGTGDEICCKFTWYFLNKNIYRFIVYFIETFLWICRPTSTILSKYIIIKWRARLLDWSVDMISKLCFVYATSSISEHWTVWWTEGWIIVFYAIWPNCTEIKWFLLTKKFNLIKNQKLLHRSIMTHGNRITNAISQLISWSSSNNWTRRTSSRTWLRLSWWTIENTLSQITNWPNVTA